MSTVTGKMRDRLHADAYEKVCAAQAALYQLGIMSPPHMAYRDFVQRLDDVRRSMEPLYNVQDDDK